MNDERWLPVAGYEDRYEVSDQGRVRAIFRGRGRASRVPRLISLKPDGSGYRCLWLTDGTSAGAASFADRGYRREYVHRLVLEAFVGPAPDGYVCRHLNDDRLDCRLSNLVWGTQLDNLADAARNERILRGEARRCTKLTEAKVLEIRRRVANGERRTELATEFGVSLRTIGDVLDRSWQWLAEAAA